ncbi:MAG: nucleotidyltransferase domain-containing protein [Bacteroidia bacterium]|nr:nucleotidyltransferase domain-containing protein [Bacteroidia bacterium]
MHTSELSFPETFSRFLNFGYLDSLQGLLSAVAPGAVSGKNAERISRLHAGLATKPGGTPLRLNIPVYDHGYGPVEKIGQAVKTFESHLAGAYVHGSFATGDHTAYSDFDGLLIVKDETVSDPVRLAQLSEKTRGTLKLMLEIDPLQHHGWFALSEKNLSGYPEQYLPVEVLKYAQSLLPEKGLQLSLTVCSLPRSGEHFRIFVRHLARRLPQLSSAKNLYTIKAVLSQFMLLPALYVESRDGKGIYKRESFASAKKDFSGQEWKIMDEVSAIRFGWKQEYARLPRRLFSGSGFIGNEWRKRFGVKAPESLMQLLTPSFCERMGELSERMLEKSESAGHERNS